MSVPPVVRNGKTIEFTLSVHRDDLALTTLFVRLLSHESSLPSSQNNKKKEKKKEKLGEGNSTADNRCNSVAPSCVSRVHSLLWQCRLLRLAASEASHGGRRTVDSFSSLFYSFVFLHNRGIFVNKQEVAARTRPAAARLMREKTTVTVFLPRRSAVRTAFPPCRKRQGLGGLK